MLSNLSRKILSFRPNILVGVVFPIILIVLGVFLFSSTTPKVQNLVISSGENIIKSTKPIFQTIKPKNATYIIDFETKYEDLSQKHLKIAVTGCLEFLEINNKEYPTDNLTGKIVKTKVDEFREKIDCDNDKFMVFDLTRYAKAGESIKFQMLMQNEAGDVGFVWHGYEYDLIFVIILGIVNLGFLLLLIFVCSKLGLSRLLASIIFGGVLIREYYLSKTEFWFRSYDLKDFFGTGHLGFIEYVANNLKLPNSDVGWQFHQAPLYYVINGLMMRVSSVWNLHFDYTLLQFFNLIVFVGFVIISCKILKEVFLSKSHIDAQEESWINNFFSRSQNEFFVIVGALVINFLPSMVIHSVRISNDVLFYFFSSLVIYYLLKFSKSKSFIDKNIFWATVFTSFGIATKVNSLILLVLIIAVFIIKFIILSKNTHTNLFTHKILSSIVIFVLIIGLGVGAGFYKKIEAKIKDPSKDWLVTSESILNKKLFVDNNLGNFVFFDAKSFLTVTSAQGFSDIGGRQSYFVYLFKTAIGAEFFYNNMASNYLIALYCLVFLILLFFAYLMVTCKKHFFADNWFMLTTLSIFVLASVYYRTKTPCACNQDFRFILPSIVPFVIILFALSKRLNKNEFPVLYYLFWICVLTLVPVSILFIFNV